MCSEESEKHPRAIEATVDIKKGPSWNAKIAQGRVEWKSQGLGIPSPPFVDHPVSQKIAI